jgi:hypothetical protein
MGFVRGLTGLFIAGLLGCGSSDTAISDAIPPTPAVPDAGALRHADGGQPQARGAAAPNATTGGKKPGAGSGADAGGSGASADDTCASLLIPALPNSPQVLIVLDRSGSMLGNNNTNTDRWTPSSSAIAKITAQLDQAVEFGLLMFPDPAMAMNNCAAGAVNVPVALGTSKQIAQAINSSPPNRFSATPTAASLQAALAALGPPSICADQCVVTKRYVLLVTDGAPNCGAAMGPNMFATTQADIDACDANIDALKAADITTYVIGYQTTSDPAVATIMDGFAMHGGTGKQLPVENEQSLVDTLTSIARSLVPCEYKLSMKVQDAKFVRVTIDGKQYDLGTGWTLKDDMQTVVLAGACDVLHDVQSHNLSITLECTPVIVL